VTVVVFASWAGLAPWEQAVLAAFMVLVGGLVLYLFYCRSEERRGGARSRDRKDGSSARVDDPCSQRTGPDEEDSTLRLDPEAAGQLASEPGEDAPEEAQTCHNCHHVNEPGSVFCDHCGCTFRLAEMRQQLSWDKGELILSAGRDPDVEIPLYDPTSSSRHAEIVFRRGALLIRDLGSTNGTWIHGTRVTASTLLGPGDNITFGRDVRTYDFIISALAKEIAKRSQPG